MFLGDLLYILTPSPAHGHDPGAMVRKIASKLAGKLESGYERDIRTYARTHITSRRNAICPTPAFGRWGHKKNIAPAPFQSRPCFRRGSVCKNANRKLYEPKARLNLSKTLCSH